MADLILGVVEVPYENDGKKAPRKRQVNKTGRSKGEAEHEDRGPTTTVTVAKILEEKYGLFQVFYDDTQDHIAGTLIHGLEGALADLYAGAPVNDPYAEAGQEIMAGFRQWLMQGEIEHLGVEGVPTKAAIERRSLRFKSKEGPAQRPSFIDSATLELAFRSWVE